MSNLDIDRVLTQMQVLRDQVRGTAIRPEVATDFGAMLKNSIDQVNGLQQQAKQMARAFETGDPEMTLADVMIAQQKASISFQAMTQVRNKLVEAYKDVMNMSM